MLYMCIACGAELKHSHEEFGDTFRQEIERDDIVTMEERSVPLQIRHE